jgi:serine/threonine protein kinase
MTDKIAHYNVLERLGGGALGDVYRARDTKVGRTVALMQPPGGLISDADRRQRFLDAARVAATLNHPNIAALFDVVEQDGRCYLAYEFAAGPSLRQEMVGVALNVRRALELASQIADALAEGHTRGIVHGDLRPDTVVVTPKGSTKILNFGMVPWTAGGAARALAALSPATLSGDELLVVAYLSPEQALGGKIDARSDLFSLGVILYEMIAGRNPFQAPTAAATALNVIRAPAPAPSLGNKEVPPELDALLAQALAKDIESRPDNAASFAAELRRLVSIVDARAGEHVPPASIPLDEDHGGRGKWIAVAAAAAALASLWWFKC